MPKISVIMPTYNVERYFRQCLESVINQTFADIEIIPVDDGSPDNCGAIMDEYAAKDPRIKPIHQLNGGYGKAINAGLDAATGEYVAIVETDDWVEPDMVEILYNAAKESGCEVVKGSFTKHDEGVGSYPCPLRQLTGDSGMALVCPVTSLPLMIYEASIWSAIYKREFLKKFNIRMLETKGAAYQDLVFKFMVYSSLDKVLLIDRPVYNYRVFAVGSSSTDKGKAGAMARNYEVVRRFLEEQGKFEEFKEAFYVHQIFDFNYHLGRLGGKARSLFLRDARRLIVEAESVGVDIYNITCTNDCRDYLYKEIIPLYESIKTSFWRTAMKRQLTDFGYKFARRFLRAPFYAIFLRPLEWMIRDGMESLRQDFRKQLEKTQSDLYGHTTNFWESQSNAWENAHDMHQKMFVFMETTQQQLDKICSDINAHIADNEAHIADSLDDRNKLVSSSENNRDKIFEFLANTQKQFEKGQSDLYGHIANFWESQDKLWDDVENKQDKIFELLATTQKQLEKGHSDISGNITNFRESQSKAWQDAGDIRDKTLAGVNALVRPVMTAPSAQFEYYLRAHETELPEKIASLKKGLDADSIFQVDKYFKTFKVLPVNTSKEEIYYYPLSIEMFSDDERFVLANYGKIMARLHESYGNMDMSEIPFSLNAHYYECGIKILPNQISEKFAGTIALDCGAWVGDTAISIARYGFKKVHCFEPLPDNFVVLERNIKKNDLGEYIVPHNLAVDETVSELAMTKVGENGVGSLVAKEGEFKVKAVSIDEFLKDEADPVTLIKLDVEGRELAALKGAMATIQKHRPVLLVAAYHTWIEPEQIFEIKEYIESLDLGYRFKFKCMQPEKDMIYEYGFVCWVG